MALQNLIIDRGEKVVPVSAWHDAHTLKSPDLTKGQKGSDKQALQNKGLAVVHVSRALKPAQRSQIDALLVNRFGRAHYLAEQVDTSIVGGARIRVGDMIIDGSIATRLQDLRTKLAG